MRPVNANSPVAPAALRFGEIPEAHLDRALDHAALVFHESYDEDARVGHRTFLKRCERVGAYDGEQLVGLLAAVPLQLSVPGGQLPCAGVTFVSVAPTHRRRGVLTGMLGELWRLCAAAGRPLAALWASEAAIYGRFGFGPGTQLQTVEIDSVRPLDLRVTPDPRPLRLIPAADAPALVGPLYEANRAERAGRLARDAYWWREIVLPEKAEDDDELGPPRVVVLGADPPAGYAVYRVRDSGGDTPDTVQLIELEAETAAVAAALWKYLADIDLTGRVRTYGRPADDVLPLISGDRDQVRVVGESPALWIRLADVRAALTARSWAAPVDLVLDIRDAAIPANEGRFRLTTDAKTCTCEPVTDPADLSVDIRELSACYLGGTRLVHYLRAGLITEHTPGAARVLDDALHTEYLPFTTDGF
ncbi:GNAT family N-acetyltransferase [Streptomyces sp. NPDC050610]|uniref:GNAT family N-acetyltransferase n=1 Tax=Streptomyces sp. NPDC050610 TaxID=3157097 RepID=UPI003445041B